MKRENNKKFKKRKRNQKRSLTCRVLSMMFAIVLFSFDDMVDMVEVEEDSAAVDTSEDTGDDLGTDVNFESEEGSAETYSESDDFGSSDADFSSGENMFTDGTSESSAPAEEAAQPVSCIVNLKNETIEIKAEAPVGVLPNGTQMIVKAVENNTEDAELTDQYNKLAAKITEQLQSQSKNLDGFLAYNVSFTDADGNPVEPAGKVNYSFTYKEASSPELTDPEDKRRIGYIQAEAGRMKELVEELLFLARSDAGRLTAEKTHLDLSFLIESCALTFEPVAFEQGKLMETDVEPDLMIEGEEQKLKQLAEILLDNACKYSEPGSTIRVSLKQSSEKKLRFTVISQGTPLTKEEQKQIFERFYRADPSRGKTGGYGLGLAIAQEIVRMHGGKIWAESDGEKENSFIVEF